MIAVVAAITTLNSLDTETTVHQCSSDSPLVSCQTPTLSASAADEAVVFSVQNKGNSAKTLQNISLQIGNQTEECLDTVTLKKDEQKHIRCHADLVQGQRNNVEVTYQSYTTSEGDTFPTAERFRVSVTPGTTPVPGIAQRVPDIIAAYGLTSLSSTYSGPVVHARRSIDDTTQSFTAEEVLDGTLEEWVQGGDARAVRLYDQSGNGHTAGRGGSRPLIVQNGSLITVQGSPALYFTRADSLRSRSKLSPRDLTIVQKVTTQPRGGYNDHATYAGCKSLIRSSATRLLVECGSIYEAKPGSYTEITPNATYVFGSTFGPRGLSVYHQGQHVETASGNKTSVPESNVRLASGHNIRGFEGHLHAVVYFDRNLNDDEHETAYRELS